LACHDTAGTYKKWLGGMPQEKVDLLKVAQNVGRSSRQTCDRCHQDSQEVDFRKPVHQGTDFEIMYSRGRDVKALIDQTDYIGFRDLGYKGDPIIYGGRLKKLPLGRKEDSNR